MPFARLLAALAALFAASGVGLWAHATHAGATSAVIAAQMLLIHGVALLALLAARETGLVPRRFGALAMGLLVAGVTLFAADLALRAYAGERLFPMASPLGGVLMIVGWVALAVGALVAGRR
jgi:uncharacterized membrane protein YgdD (TMEM256/DUF423 family)